MRGQTSYKLNQFLMHSIHSMRFINGTGLKYPNKGYALEPDSNKTYME
jgi:hypothetical protein